MKQLNHIEENTGKKWVPLKLPKGIGKNIGTELRNALLTEGGAHYYYKEVTADKSPSGKAFRYRNWVTTPDKLELCQQIISDAVRKAQTTEKKWIPLELPKNIGYVKNKDISTELQNALLAGGAYYYYKQVPADKSPSGKAFRYKNWVTTPDNLELCQELIADAELRAQERLSAEKRIPIFNEHDEQLIKKAWQILREKEKISDVAGEVQREPEETLKQQNDKKLVPVNLPELKVTGKDIGAEMWVALFKEGDMHYYREVSPDRTFRYRWMTTPDKLELCQQIIADAIERSPNREKEGIFDVKAPVFTENGVRYYRDETADRIFRSQWERIWREQNKEKEGISGANFEDKLKEKTSEAQRGAEETSKQQKKQHQEEMAV